MPNILGIRGKSFIVAMLATILFLISALPISAEESVAKSEIRVKPGSGQMKINGDTVKIQPPYRLAGEVMVPLSVFTNPKGFGAKVQLKDNKIITLTYLKHVIVLTYGSKSATIDGKKVTLTVAPINKKGVTMVPLSIIAKSFGAAQKTDSVTKEIVINGVVANNDSATRGIDSDSGKSQIGDSYYKWSMNYPSGLVQDKQWSNGDWITFRDVKGNYYLAISIDEADELLSSNDKRELLRDSTGEETVIDMKTVTRSKDSYERMITKDDSGFYYEYRGIQANGYFYTLTFGKKAKSSSELNAHAALLDSFNSSFNASNKSLKDLARIINGKISYEINDYGLKLQLPKEWSQDTDVSSPYFYGPDESYLLMDVYSLKDDDTLTNWVDRKNKLFKDNLVEAFRKDPETSAITWNGVPAILVKLAYSTDGKIWMNEYEVHAVKGKYKYYVDYTFKQEDKDDESVRDVVKQVLEGLSVDFAKLEKSFGNVPDPEDTADYDTKTTKTSKKYGYSITLPKMWTNGTQDMEKESVTFASKFGANFMVAIEEGTSMAGYPELLEKMYVNLGVMNMDSKTNVTFAGASGYKYEYSTTKLADVAAHLTLYLIEKNGNIYLIQGMQVDSSATELNRKRLEDTMKSFQFTK